MNKHFTQNAVLVGPTGLYAVSLNFTQPSSNSYALSVGSTPSLIGAGSQVKNLSINYILNISGDPILNHVASNITEQPFFTNTFGGNSGNFYIDSFSLQIAANGSPAICDVNFINYHGISGDYGNRSLGGLNINYQTSSSVSACLSGFNGILQCGEVNFSYANILNPRYKIGQKTPHEIAYFGNSYGLEVELFARKTGDFYGSLSNYLLDNELYLVLENEPSTVSKRISISGYLLNDLQEALSVNDSIVKYKAIFTRLN